MSKVLLVDDDEDFLEIASLLIKAKGYECEKASNIKDAINIAAQSPPDCCVLDIRLENNLYGDELHDGVGLFEELKQLLKRCRVVFASAHTDYEEGFLQRRGAVALIDKANFAKSIDKALKEVFYPRLLLVEDDADFAYSVAGELNKRGIKCIAITDKKQMESYLRECDFTVVDIVVSDVLLDEENSFHGWDVLDLISTTCSMDSVYLLTGKTLTEIKAHIGQLFHDLESRQKFLATITGLSEQQVLSKEGEAWIETIESVCKRAKS